MFAYTSTMLINLLKKLNIFEAILKIGPSSSGVQECALSMALVKQL